MFSFCPKTTIHSLSAVCREMSGCNLQVGLFKISNAVRTFYSLIYTNVTIPYLHALERWGAFLWDDPDQDQ